MWQLPDGRRLRAGLANFLKALGNYGANRQVSIAELKADAWREAANEAYATLFGDLKLDFSKTSSFLIVPDDVLWYLPFEVLSPTGANSEKLLADCLTIRYGPTAALAVGRPAPLRRPQHTGIVAGDLKLGGDGTDRDALLQELKSVLSGPLVLPDSLPEPANLVSPLLDYLIVLAELAGNADIGEAVSLFPQSRGGKDALGGWIMLPFGGPEQIVLTGVSTAAEQGLKAPKRGTSRGGVGRSARPGSEVFQALCNLMSGGARTILMTRWQTGGRTNFDLVREFAKELPNVPAADAWQRACLLAREAPLDASREPRLKRSDESGQMPKADHPFFWAGYLLVDTGPRPEPPEQTEIAKNAAQPDGPTAKPLPPPDKSADETDEADKAPPAKAAEDAVSPKPAT
jgi:hypothetical protein